MAKRSRSRSHSPRKSKSRSRSRSVAKPKKLRTKSPSKGQRMGPASHYKVGVTNSAGTKVVRKTSTGKRLVKVPKKCAKVAKRGGPKALKKCLNKKGSGRKRSGRKHRKVSGKKRSGSKKSTKKVFKY